MTIRSSLVFKTELDFNDVDSISKREEIKKRMVYDKRGCYNTTSVNNNMFNKTLDLAGYLFLHGINPSTGKNILNNKIKFFEKSSPSYNVVYYFNPRPEKLKLGINVVVEGNNLDYEMKISNVFDADKLNSFILDGWEGLVK
jgi:hypothetical protein